MHASSSPRVLCVSPLVLVCFDPQEFAAALRSLPSPPFIGATAGIRHAMSTGAVTEDHVAAMRALLPVGAVLAVSTIKRPIFELVQLAVAYVRSGGLRETGGRHAARLGMGSGSCAGSLRIEAYGPCDGIHGFSQGVGVDRIRQRRLDCGLLSGGCGGSRRGGLEATERAH